ncbi:dienelactone hydrolase family protein [Maricaulis sp.]|uniref:dienelactone hydrolase family protein n=1 Tax=Maricaulis sp. TaxID=1486257 RepID=UPI003A92D68A
MTPSPHPHRTAASATAEVTIPPLGLRGILRWPDNPVGLVIFAHGSGSSRLSPRNNHVAEALSEAGLATLLFDLLSPAEEADRTNVFDIPVLAGRLTDVINWTGGIGEMANLPLGLFGASTGSAAALMAAAKRPDRIAAVVSRGGRPDLARDALPAVRAPTLLIVGGADGEVVTLNEAAAAQLGDIARLTIIPGATHLFPEPGALDAVVAATRDWFLDHLAGPAIGRKGRDNAV